MATQSSLKALMNVSKVVVDSANLSQIDSYQPIDATTNPSSVLQAVSILDHGVESLLNETEVQFISQVAESNQQSVELVYDHLLVALASKILTKVKGYVSIEVDAEYAYDSKNTLKRARQIIAIAKDKQIDYQRILIKVASTWQGIEATKELEKERICCNLTLVFNYYQAMACAKAGAHTISPFVGRVLDWYKSNHQNKDFSNPDVEPGVNLVRSIYQSFKKENIPTIIMGASFRNIGEIIALAGCDKLTIHPKFLKQLSELDTKISEDINKPTNQYFETIEINENGFNEKINQDKMAKELLKAGINDFVKDTRALKAMIEVMIK